MTVRYAVSLESAEPPLRQNRHRRPDHAHGIRRYRHQRSSGGRSVVSRFCTTGRPHLLEHATDTNLEHHDNNDTNHEHHDNNHEHLDNNDTNHDRRQNTSRPEQQCRRCRAAQRPGGRRPGRGTGGTEYGFDGDTGCAGTGPTTDNWSGHLDAGLAGGTVRRVRYHDAIGATPISPPLLDFEQRPHQRARNGSAAQLTLPIVAADSGAEIQNIGDDSPSQACSIAHSTAVSAAIG